VFLCGYAETADGSGKGPSERCEQSDQHLRREAGVEVEQDLAV
jgi:hypothetical protein